MQRHNSTITVKEKPCSCGCGNSGYPFSGGLLYPCWKRLKGKPIAKISSKRLDSLNDDDLSVLIDELDTIFSRYIRIRDADNKGIITCYGCGSQKRWRDAHCSHFMPRTHLATRWLPVNAAASCAGCNTLGRGRLDKFEILLESKQNGLVEWLRELALQVTKPHKHELKELLIELRSKLKAVQLKLIS